MTFTMALMFRAVSLDKEGESVAVVIHWILGGLGYIVAVNTLGIYSRLKDPAATIAKIDARLAKLDPKE